VSMATWGWYRRCWGLRLGLLWLCDWWSCLNIGLGMTRCGAHTARCRRATNNACCQRRRAVTQAVISVLTTRQMTIALCLVRLSIVGRCHHRL
jgi:hypothetical protein